LTYTRDSAYTASNKALEEHRETRHLFDQLYRSGCLCVSQAARSFADAL